MPLRLTVIDRSEKLKTQVFDNFAGKPDIKLHAPVNWHGYAACTGGILCNNYKNIPQDKPVLFVCGKRTFKKDMRSIIELKNKGFKIAMAIKGTGPLQMLNRINSPKKIETMKYLINGIAGVICPTKFTVPVIQSLRDKSDGYTTAFIPTPYPVEYKEWDFSIDDKKRKNIFLGTREFNHPNRYHLYSLIFLKDICRKTGESLTVINQDSRLGKKFYKSIGFKENEINIIKRKPYPEYLSIMSKHKFVFQLDQSAVPGQVASDAMLCRLPCIGGNGANENILFPGLTVNPENLNIIKKITLKMIQNKSYRLEIIKKSQQYALEFLSFSVINKALNEFYNKL